MTLQIKQDHEIKSSYRKVSIGGGKTRDLHRVIMERALGRTLTADEVVHHIDGNKLNNSPDNLTVMSKKAHSRLHLVDQPVDKLHTEEAKRKNRVAIAAYWETHRSPYSKKVARCDDKGNVLEVYDSAYRVRLAGFDHRHVSACCNGKRKKHKGFLWMFVD
jgi:hypothetical protein